MSPRIARTAARAAPVVLGLAALVALAACRSGENPGLAVVGLEGAPSPAAAGSGEPNLTVGPDGVVYLSWLEPSDAGHALRFARWEGDGWGAARTVIDRPGLFVNWADFPSMAVLGDGTLAAHWLEKSGPGTYAYDVRLALSSDGGATWSADIVPHRDGVEAEHGFVSMVPFDRGLAALWLDGRGTPDGGPMTLRFTTLDRSGGLGPEVRVDGMVCDCCQTAMAAAPGGLVATYRDRTDEEVRDISVVRYADGEWSEPRPVHGDGWVIAGCPVNGPAIDASGDTVVVAWFTAGDSAAAAETSAEVRAAGERGRVLAAFSTDGGATFREPIRVDDGQAMGRVDVLAPGGGAALVTWLERTDAGAEVRVRRVHGPGAGDAADPSTRAAIGPGQAVTGTAAARASGFPQMAASDDDIFFAWTQPGEGGGVRTSVGRLPGGGSP